MKRDTLFFDVDTQYDFISPQGKLHVPGAESVLDNISAVRCLALERGYSILASMDYHSADNAEIFSEPDFKTTFPPHCMADQSGAERIGYLGDVPIDYIGPEKADVKSLERLINKEQFHIAVRKETTDPFQSSNIFELFAMMQPQKAIVFGIALDVCVYNVVKDMNKNSDTSVYVVKDAVKGLDVIPAEQVYEEFEKMSVQVISLDKLKEML